MAIKSFRVAVSTPVRSGRSKACRSALHQSISPGYHEDSHKARVKRVQTLRSSPDCRSPLPAHPHHTAGTLLQHSERESAESRSPVTRVAESSQKLQNGAKERGRFLDRQ